MNKFYLIIGGIFFILAVSAAASEKEYVLIEIAYESGTFNLINETLEKGNYPFIEHENNYGYNFYLVSDKKEIFFSGSFDPTLIFTDGLNISNNESFEGGAIELNESNFFIAVPNIKKAEKIEIFKNNEKIFEAELDFNPASSCRIR